MSVLIKGMEMPKNCGRCWFNKSSLSCAITGSCIDRDDENRERLDDCPFVEVPKPHGRLIDADALADDLDYDAKHFVEGHEMKANCASWLRSDAIQTIIEAEGK